MKYFTIISSLLLISFGKSFLFSKINSKRTQRLFSEAPSNYEDDFKYSEDYYQKKIANENYSQIFILKLFFILIRMGC